MGVDRQSFRFSADQKAAADFFRDLALKVERGEVRIGDINVDRETMDLNTFGGQVTRQYMRRLTYSFDVEMGEYEDRARARDMAAAPPPPETELEREKRKIIEQQMAWAESNLQSYQRAERGRARQEIATAAAKGDPLLASEAMNKIEREQRERDAHAPEGQRKLILE